jgi:type III pantothenate kinase
MLLAIDIGNTRIKTAVFEENTLLTIVIFEKKELSNQINLILKKFPLIKFFFIANVGRVLINDFSEFENKVEVYFITKDSKFPFHNLYSTPSTLGIDRMVLASGAVIQYPNQNRLVIDAGTCITYDFIDENNNYYGGAISPGIRLRYESLHNYTAKLPLLLKSNPKKIVGESTNESIHSGIINGIAYEIEGFIKSLEVQNANFIIILTGGDAEFLAIRLKNTIFANPNFLLESMNQTFQYNNND